MSLFCAGILLLIAVALPGAADAQIKIKASYGSPSLTQVIFPLGVQAGVFQRNGLSVEAVYIAGRSISALLGGDVQFGFVGGPQTIQARISGADLIVIGGLNRLGQMIVVHPSIKTPADLVGKKVGRRVRHNVGLRHASRPQAIQSSAQ